MNKTLAAKDFTSERKDMLESIRKILEKAKEWMKLNANKHCLAALDYTIGQQVWLATENLQLTRTSPKLTERWLGPYTIIGLAGPNAIKLKLHKYRRNMYNEMSVTLISVSYNTVVSNKHEERTRHYYVNFQHSTSLFMMYILRAIMTSCSSQNAARSDSL